MSKKLLEMDIVKTLTKLLNYIFGKRCKCKRKVR